MSIFKAYDIRGVVPEEIDEKIAYQIGAAFATFLDAKTLVVGRDMRTHSPWIQKALIEGITSTGCNVINIDLASTPMTYFAIATLTCDGGINVTASHNPGQYNGFKLAREGARPISGETGIRDIEKLVRENGPFRKSKAAGTVERKDVLVEYAEHVKSFMSPAANSRKIKVAMDAANGMACHTVPSILDRLPSVEAVKIFFQLDGTFPSHEANPLKEENLTWLKRAVVEDHCDIGIAFDGDADRCMIVDEKGQSISSDLVTALLACEFLKTAPKSTIVYDLRSSWVVPEEIQKAGGRPLRERVGHSFIKGTMRKENASFGGELSGHFYFAKNFFCDSGEIAMAAILNLLSQSTQPLSERFAKLRRYFATGEINFQVADKNAKIQAVRKKFADARQDELDGITIAYGNPGDKQWWWCNVRASNTEPLLRLNLEASSQKLMEDKKAEVLSILGTPSKH